MCFEDYSTGAVTVGVCAGKGQDEWRGRGDRDTGRKAPVDMSKLTNIMKKGGGEKVRLCVFHCPLMLESYLYCRLCHLDPVPFVLVAGTARGVSLQLLHRSSQQGATKISKDK